VLRDRHPSDRHDAREHHDDRDHPREDRPVDEEPDHQSACARACGCDGGGSSAGAGTSLTVAPGFTRCCPSTFTWSPGAMPAVTSHALPIARSVLSWRTSTFPARTTSVVALPLRSRVTARCGTSSALGSLPSSRRASTYIPGSRSPAGFGT